MEMDSEGLSLRFPLAKGGCEACSRGVVEEIRQVSQSSRAGFLFEAFATTVVRF